MDRLLYLGAGILIGYLMCTKNHAVRDLKSKLEKCEARIPC